MRKFLPLFILPAILFAQEKTPAPVKQAGKYDTNKFSQMYDLLATPNMFRTAAGAPGPAYYQQQADYKIDIELDDKNAKLSGSETITTTIILLIIWSIYGFNWIKTKGQKILNLLWQKAKK